MVKGYVLPSAAVQNMLLLRNPLFSGLNTAGTAVLSKILYKIEVSLISDMISLLTNKTASRLQYFLHGGMVCISSAFFQKLFNIAITKRIGKPPPYGHQNEIAGKMTTVEAEHFPTLSWSHGSTV